MSEQSERDRIRQLRWRIKHTDSAARRRRIRPKSKRTSKSVLMSICADCGRKFQTAALAFVSIVIVES